MPLQEAVWRLDDLGDLTGRTVLVTGGTAGVGLATVAALAARGAAVIAAGRRRDAELPANAVWLPLDLADPASIQQLATTAPGILDVLINNAGVNLGAPQALAGGGETHMRVNHLGHFALTALLLPRLLRGRDPRVVSVTSEAHRRARFDVRDFEAASPAVYENSKLAMLLFAFELERRLDAAGGGVISVACHPGFIATEMAESVARSLDPDRAERLRAAVREHAWQPEDGVVTPCVSAFAPRIRGGEYLEPARADGVVVAALAEPSAEAQDPALAAAAWAESERITGVRFPLPALIP